MDENHFNILQYGHMGKATYLPESQSWTFSRTLARQPFIAYTGVTKTTVPSSLIGSATNPAQQRSWKGSFLKTHPEFIASPSIGPIEELSYVINTVTAKYDPQVSALIDFGNAVDLENDRAGVRARTEPIAVVASGENGNVLTLLRVEDELIDWEQEEGQRIRVPSIGSVEMAKWTRSAAPIRQIRFAQAAEEPAGWMAVRLPLSTVIFRPIRHRDRLPVRQQGDPYYNIMTHPQNSRLDPNPVVEIPISKTGGFAHVDVTFNPWYQKQFGIIDERGVWSIWTVSGRQKRFGSELAECVQSGSLPWLENQSRPVINQPHYDGWGAIEWAGAVNKWIVCNRRCMVLYLMENSATVARPVELRLKQNSEWILDMKRSTSMMSRVFVLTTSRIFILDIDSGIFAAEERPSLSPQLSWQHYRDPEDITLRLTTVGVGEDFFLILYSRLNTLGLGFQIPHPPKADSIPLSVPEPFVIQLPIRLNQNKRSNAQEEIGFTTLLFRELEHVLPSNRSDDGPPIRLAKLFTLDTTLAVQELLFVACLSANTPQERNVPLGREVLRLRGRRVGTRKSQKADFIVDDFDESTTTTKESKTQKPQNASTLHSTALCSTVDCTTTYLAIVSGNLPYLRREMLPLMEDKLFRACLDDLVNLCIKSNHVEAVITQTMLEMINCNPVLDDIDHNIRDFEVFRRKVGQSQGTNGGNPVRYLPLKIIDKATGISMGVRDSLRELDLYDRLVHDWLSALPRDVSGRARIIKEKLIRNIAAELSLARMLHVRSLNLKLVVPEKKETNITAEKSVNSFQDRRSLINTRLTQKEQGEKFITSSIDLEHIVNETGTCTVPALLGLNAFNRMNDHSSFPKSVNDVLSHWLPGDDPAFYDWQKTVREEEEKTRSTTPKRTIRRRSQSTNTGDESRITRMSPIVPIVQYFGSQPQNEHLKTRLHSSQIIEDNIPMTQVERGVFGGRESGKWSIAKARKKKRAAGF